MPDVGSNMIIIKNRLDTTTRAQVIRCLIEGNSIRSTVRMTGKAPGTGARLGPRMRQANSMASSAENL